MVLIFAFFKIFWASGFIIFIFQNILSFWFYYFHFWSYFYTKPRRKNIHFLSFSPCKTPKFSAASRPWFYFYTKRFYFLHFSKYFELLVLLFAFFKIFRASGFIIFISHPNLEPLVLLEGGLILTLWYHGTQHLLFSKNIPECSKILSMGRIRHSTRVLELKPPSNKTRGSRFGWEM